MKKRELMFQDHIIRSYITCGGYAKKWSSEWVAGPPDLVCCLPGLEVHLVEVKHMPNMDPENPRQYKNPMTPAQRLEAKKYGKAGGLVLLGVVAASSGARGSFLGVFDPLEEAIESPLTGWVPYVLGDGFNITKLLGALK